MSRWRSLAGDVARGLAQQMVFWGCDARHPGGNLLVRAGLRRMARVDRQGEGSSRYVMAWQSGVVELHSFCAGWYPRDAADRGAVFLRSRERLFACSGGRPLVPGDYDTSRLVGDGVEDLLEALPALVAWIGHYESRVRRLAGSEYRRACWRRFLAKPGVRPWLPPDDAVRWWGDFVRSPGAVRRPREILRRSRPTPAKPFL